MAQGFKNLLVLDIDETLLYASMKELERNSDYCGQFCHMYKRPHVDEFLEFCSEHFALGIWTTAGIRHANEVFNHVLQRPEKLRLTPDNLIPI